MLLVGKRSLAIPQGEHDAQLLPVAHPPLQTPDDELLAKNRLPERGCSCRACKTLAQCLFYPMLSKTSSGAHGDARSHVLEEGIPPTSPSRDHRCPPGSPSAHTPQLQNPVPIPNVAFRSTRSQPWAPGDLFNFPAPPGHFHRPRTTRVTWVDDREDHVTISLLSFQSIQLLFLITLLPLILLLLSLVLEGKAGENGVGKATGTAGGTDGARLALFPWRGRVLVFGEQSELSYLNRGNLKDLVHILQGQWHIPQRCLVRHLLRPWGRGVQRVTALMPAALRLPPVLLRSMVGRTLAMPSAPGSPLPGQLLPGFGSERM